MPANTKQTEIRCKVSPHFQAIDVRTCYDMLLNLALVSCVNYFFGTREAS